MKNIGIIIQARMGSTRLPGKILKPLKNKTVLECVIDRALMVKNVQKVVVATTVLEKDNAVVALLKKLNLSYFRGDENNVLSRYYTCAKEFNFDIVVRITADCPFLDPTIVDEIIDLAIKEDNDYTSNSIYRSYPHGVDAEVIKFEALEKAYNEATEEFDKEHVCPYIHTRRKDLFKIGQLKAPQDLNYPEIRITLDTPQDYQLSKRLIELLPENYDTKDIIEVYKKHPELYEINRV